MMRTILRNARGPRATALALLAAALLPSAARAQQAPGPAPAPSPEAEPEIVVEALFLCDTLPPGGRDLNLAVAIARGEPDPRTGDAPVVALPRLQLALALGERAGITVDVGLGGDGEIVHTPAASLKVLLRAPGLGRTGLSASLDLLGSTHSLAGTEAALGLGAIRQVGRVGLRASASVATGVSVWSPHLHAGASAALALGARWRGLAEVVADLDAGGLAVAAGPTLKLALGERTAIMAGALFAVAPDRRPPTFAVQIAQSM
jgi:hypothetical protein